MAESYSLRAGPSVTWDAGWDPGNPEHAKLLLDYQEQYRPRIIVCTPNIRYWELDKAGRMVLGDGDALQTMIKVMGQQMANGDFFLLKAPEVGRFWTRDYFRIVMDICSPPNGPVPVNPALMNQCCDECRFGPKCPLTARYMRNRTRFAGNYELTRSPFLLNCKGRGNRDHQAIKGHLDPTTSRSDYVREGHSKLASALVQDLLGVLNTGRAESSSSATCDEECLE